MNTSAGQPVTEATALVARLLVATGCVLMSTAPDARRAKAWLVNNQNEDGGRGPFRGQESRVWLTAMAVRALGEMDRRSPAIVKGAKWLIAARDSASRGWGELPRRGATVTHTSYVLTALADSGLAVGERAVADALADGFTWLVRHLDPVQVHDDHARLETYNVTRRDADGTVVMWENAIWHHGLPFAVSALVRQAGAVRFDLVVAGVRTLVATQMDDGRWPSADGSAAFSVWAVWPFLEALADVRRFCRCTAGRLSRHSPRRPPSFRCSRCSCGSGSTYP